MVVLVLVFVVYNRQKERHFPKADPYDDVRENIINYDDEGGGEDDMTAFDITPLQIPVGPAIGNGGPLLGKMPCECFYNLVVWATRILVAHTTRLQTTL